MNLAATVEHVLDGLKAVDLDHRDQQLGNGPRSTVSMDAVLRWP